MHDRRSTVDVVRGKRRVAQRDEERAHLARRQRVARLDRRLARDRRGEPLVLRAQRRRRDRRSAQSSVSRRHRSASKRGCGIGTVWTMQRVAAESFDLESQPLEVLAIRVERFALGGTEVQRQRKQQSLRGRCPALERAHELLVQHALVRRVLIDEHDAVVVLERDVRATQLEEVGDRLGGCGDVAR